MFDPRRVPSGLTRRDGVPPLTGLCPRDASPLVRLLLRVAVAPGVPPLTELLLEMVALPLVGLFPGLLLRDDRPAAGLHCG